MTFSLRIYSQAIAQGRELPRQASGAILFADISGFTPLTAALLEELGLKRGPEELTRQLNLVYETLIAEVHGYGGSVIGFSGDAITCWFDADDGTRATACGLAMQESMSRDEVNAWNDLGALYHHRRPPACRPPILCFWAGPRRSPTPACADRFWSGWR